MQWQIRYYDTPDFRLIRQSLDRPVYKEKLRMRSYGMAAKTANFNSRPKKAASPENPQQCPPANKQCFPYRVR